ncbi:hypothetical protein H7X87_04480 [Acetobacteraceae bacterium]|nr:hypothetical protein [Candidatus Parcubacteria bacterium]
MITPKVSSRLLLVGFQPSRGLKVVPRGAVTTYPHPSNLPPEELPLRRAHAEVISAPLASGYSRTGIRGT